MEIENGYGIIVKHGEDVITNYIISYDTMKQVCTGIGTLSLVVDNTYGDSIEIGDTITLFENSIQVMLTEVVSMAKDLKDGTEILCQDYSKRLMDYFIVDTYELEFNEASYTKGWIEQFMAEAQVTYNFLDNAGAGNLLSNNSALGLMPAYDQILNLLQQSGWYMEIDGSGVAQIGIFDVDVYSLTVLSKEQILSVKKVKDDRKYRNRGVVWGNASSQDGAQVFADLRNPTDWDIDENDLRAFVITNSNIRTNAEATAIANTGLEVFSVLREEKSLEVVGLLDVNFSTRVAFPDYIAGKNNSGVVTSYGTSMSSSGLTTHLTLDESCPRLFGFYSYYLYDYYPYQPFTEFVWEDEVETGNTWLDICWSDDLELFCIVGGGYSAVSADGLTWEVSDSLSHAFTCVTWGRGKFKAGGNGEICSSDDGLTWTLEWSTLEPDDDVTGIDYSDELDTFVAVTWLATNGILINEEEDTWQVAINPAGNHIPMDVAWGSGANRFVGITGVTGLSPQNSYVIKSLEGDSSPWYSTTLSGASYYSNDWWRIAYSPDLDMFVATSSGGGDTGYDRVLTSTDCVTWTLRDAPVIADWYGICWASEFSVFIAVGQKPGTQSACMHSSDGINWTESDIPDIQSSYMIAASPLNRTVCIISTNGKILVGHDVEFI